ncbi:hypothetical protein HYE60_10950 [Aggregatibacter actinomycetemcomitans]|uniref:hypothetical protein n=1 Tax=Aggregatibacter actinomycetemcomitans TaxID=714 RepID=UPI00197B4678|nr:hypothetical protein [Aggregatibacter actinomycetemcomitans]MBN6075751.1 hypothetical protein [Aggregatibacter actinomycetemcomitans]
MARKIIQITETMIPETEHSNLEHTLTALCDDGTVWHKSYMLDKWVQIENVPQDD